MAPTLPKHLELAGILIIVAAGTALVVSMAKRMPALSVAPSSLPSSPQTAIYNPSAICAGAYNQNLDFRDLEDNHFTVTLQEGCFGGWVRVPRSWTTWFANVQGDTTGVWYWYWFDRDQQPLGPFHATGRYTLQRDTHQPFRLQGHGTLAFYTNQAVKSRANNAEEQHYPPPLPAAPAIPPVSAGDFKFEVKLCTKNGARIRCYGTIANTAREPQEFHWRSYDSFVLDNLGNQSSGDKFNFQVGDGSGKALLPDAPVAWSFVTDDTGPGITHITIAIAVAPSKFPLPGEGRNLAALRDIPLVEK